MEEVPNATFSPFQKRKGGESPLRKSLIGLRNSKDDAPASPKTEKQPISRSVSAFDLSELEKKKAAQTDGALKMKKALYKIVSLFFVNI